MMRPSHRRREAPAVAGVLAAAVVLISAVVPDRAATQELPDFSGSWTSSSPGGRGGRPAGTMGSGWGSSITIKQAGETLTVERVIFEPGDLQPAMKFRYSLDGFETTNTVLMGRGMQEQVSTTAWDGDILVIATVFPMSGDGTPGVAAGTGAASVTARVEQRLSLRRSGSLVRPPTLVVETTIGGVLGGPPTVTRTVYTQR